MFSSVKLLTGPPAKMARGSLVEPVAAPVELDNAPVEPDKRRSSEMTESDGFEALEVVWSLLQLRGQ